MPRLDIYHQQVRTALEKDGWKITHDPFPITIGKKRLYADLGAETLFSAEREQQKIVVEVKSFIGRSIVKDLQQALGQFVLYERILATRHPERMLYLAVDTHAAEEIFDVELGQILLDSGSIKVIVFDAEKEIITAWLPR